VPREKGSKAQLVASQNREDSGEQNALASGYEFVFMSSIGAASLRCVRSMVQTSASAGMNQRNLGGALVELNFWLLLGCFNR
jgi:hypothetical protein